MSEMNSPNIQAQMKSRIFQQSLADLLSECFQDKPLSIRFVTDAASGSRPHGPTGKRSQQLQGMRGIH